LVWEAKGYDNQRVMFRGIGTGQQQLRHILYIAELKDKDGWVCRKGYVVLRYD